MQIERFLARHPDFVVLPALGIWAEVCPGAKAPVNPGAKAPVNPGAAAPGEGPYLALSPARQGTDGFFAAVMERRA